MMLYRLVLIVVCLLAQSQLTAQVAIPVDREIGERRSYRPALYGHVGLNMIASRKFRPRRINNDGIKRLFGVRAGIGVMFRPERKSAWWLGVDYLLERGNLLGHGNRRSVFTDDVGVELESEVRNGLLTMREQWIRSSVGQRRTWGRIDLVYGLGLNFWESNAEHTYSFDRTVNGFVDQVTGRVVPLREPVEINGQSRLFSQREYFSFLAGVNYRLTERIRLCVEYDRSLHLFGDLSEGLFSRGRVGLMLRYDFR